MSPVLRADTRGGNGRERIALEAERYLVSGDSPGAQQFLAGLRVAYSWRERLGQLLEGSLRIGPRRPRRLRVSVDARGVPESTSEDCWNEAITLVQDAVAEGCLDALDSQSVARLAWILWRSYPGGGRALVFLFTEGAAVPQAVVKLRRRLNGQEPLGREWDALSRLWPQLPAGSVPRPIAYRSSAVEWLVMTPVAGRPAYVQLHSTWRPYRCASTHLSLAARWLAEFQRRTASTRRLRPERDLPGASRWAHDALVRTAGRCWPVLASAHGDYWARNLMVHGAHAAAIDWEQFCDAAPAHEDLFHFLVTYAVSFPGPGLRRASTEVAIRRAFLSRTPLAGAISDAALSYCRQTGLDPALLNPLFACYLTAGPPVVATQQAAWMLLAEELQRSPQAVFSAT